MLALARIMCANIHSQNGTAILAQVLLFTQVRKFETHPPSPGMAAEPDLSQIPPSDIPDALQDGIGKLSTPLKQLLMGKSVPYLIQHRLGTENYVTVEIAGTQPRWPGNRGQESLALRPIAMDSQ